MRGFVALLAIALLAPALASADAAEVEAPWWRATTMDADGDGLDDALAPLLAGADPLTVLVDYAQMPTPAQVAALDAAGFRVVNRYDHFPVLAVQTPPAAVPALLDMPGVVFVETNDVLVPLLKESVPLIGAPQAWATYGTTGKGVVVAVLDDGSYQQHPDFRGKIAASFNAGLASTPFGVAQQQATSVVVPVGENGHGTHVAGTIVGGGSQSGGVYKGVAPDARFVDVQVFQGPNQTNSDIVLKGLDWVLSNREALGIRVASMSLGGRASDGKDAISRGVDVAVAKGLVVVAAAGNVGPGANTITAPGAAEQAITVGAVDKQKRIAGFSSRGPTLDGRTKPDLVAPGSGIVSTIPPVSSASATNVLGGKADANSVYYGALSGTSMAAPHVSGVVALMLQANPELTPVEVKRILLATAQDLDATGRDNATGYGFVNAIAAVQVAQDPELLQSARFREVLAAVPEPPSETFVERARYQLETAQREGVLPFYLAGVVFVAALVILGVALVARRRR